MPNSLRHETTEQLRAKISLAEWIQTFNTTCGLRRRAASRKIRELAVLFPWLGDLIPDDVWQRVYHVADRVRAAGTIAPVVVVANDENDDDDDAIALAQTGTFAQTVIEPKNRD